MGVTGVTHSFTAFIPQGLDKQDYIMLLAHERLHNWTGKKIRNNLERFIGGVRDLPIIIAGF